MIGPTIGASMGILSFFFGNKNPSLEDGKALQDALNPNTVGDSESARINAAARLMTSRKFDECIAAYRAIAADFPASAGECEGQVGAALYFKGDYEGALTAYVAGRDQGADAEMMDDNIWEAIEAIAKPLAEPARKEAYFRYETHCPEGSYLKKLRKLYP